MKRVQFFFSKKSLHPSVQCPFLASRDVQLDEDFIHSYYAFTKLSPILGRSPNNSFSPPKTADFHCKQVGMQPVKKMGERGRKETLVPIRPTKDDDRVKKSAKTSYH